eukprot:1845942-Prymnesium_polylepis.3
MLGAQNEGDEGDRRKRQGDGREGVQDRHPWSRRGRSCHGRRPTSGISATRDRQNELLGKGDHRDAEKAASEGPVGTLKTASMPKRKHAKEGGVAHKKQFFHWMRSAPHPRKKVRAARAAV